MLLLLIPTMTWAYLRVPRMKRPVEFLCLLPIAIPAIVLVVGIAPIYSILREPRAAIAAGPRAHRHHPRAAVRPPRHRRRPAVDRRRDAGRGGAQPGCRLAARHLADHRPQHPRRHPVRGGHHGRARARRVHDRSLLNYDTLQVVINLLGKRDAFVAVAVSLGALVFAFLLILALANFAPTGRRSSRGTVRRSAPDGSVRRAGRRTAARTASRCSCSTCTGTTDRSTRWTG